MGSLDPMVNRAAEFMRTVMVMLLLIVECVLANTLLCRCMRDDMELLMVNSNVGGPI